MFGLLLVFEIVDKGCDAPLVSVGRFPSVSFFPQCSQEWDHRAKYMLVLVAQVMGCSGPGVRLEDPPPRAWAGSVIVLLFVTLAWMISPLIFLLGVEMWESAQVGEWECQTCYRLNLKVWKHLLKHHGQWSVISAPSQAFQNSVTSGCCLDVCPYENGGQEKIGPHGISYSEAYRRENHALVYFL